MIPESLVSMFETRSSACPDATALLFKQDGRYHPVVWHELAARAHGVAAGLVRLGVQPGDRVGILSENRREWIEADFGIMSAGAITVALHAPLTADQVREQFADCEPVIVFVSTAEQRDKLAAARHHLRSVREVYIFEEAAAGRQARPLGNLIPAAADAAVAKELQSRQCAVSPDGLAAIIYTSGTTGEPKGAMLSHANFMSNVRAMEAQNRDEAVQRVLAFLPFSHVYARTVDLYWSLDTGRTIGLAESLDTLLSDFQAVRPHYFSGVPRIHEKFAALARPCFEAGDRGALRNLLGGEILRCSSGGAALSPSVAAFYWTAGVPLYQGYGLTETSPVISFSYPDHNKIGASGVALQGVEVKIAPDGEILSRGPHIMKGYWNNPEATSQVIDADGWFHTGDIGSLDEDGFLTITDRKKDILVTAYGKNVAPQQIEGLLCFDPFIEQACVYGDGKPYLTALLVPCADALAQWTAAHGLAGAPLPDLLHAPAVNALYAARVSEALCNLASHEQVKKFILLPEPFSFDRGEVTVTAKLRRESVIDRYREKLDALYA